MTKDFRRSSVSTPSGVSGPGLGAPLVAPTGAGRGRLETTGDGEQPRITVWWCDECGYWRREQSTGVHQTTNPEDPNGRMARHKLRPVTFEMVKP